MEMLDGLISSGVTTFEEIKDNMISRFGDDRSELSIRTDLSQMKMRSTEKVIDFYEKLIREAEKVDLPETERFFVFLNALPKNMKEHTMLQEPDNLKLSKWRKFLSKCP